MNIHYIMRRGCPSCAAYVEDVIDPLAEEYPGMVVKHEAWGGFMERANNRKPITRVPLVIVMDGEREVERMADLPARERLEDILCAS